MAQVNHPPYPRCGRVSQVAALATNTGDARLSVVLSPRQPYAFRPQHDMLPLELMPHAKPVAENTCAHCPPPDTCKGR